MSRIGRKPVIIPANVTVDIAEGNNVTVKGPKGTLNYTFHPEIGRASCRERVFRAV